MEDAQKGMPSGLYFNNFTVHFIKDNNYIDI